MPQPIPSYLLAIGIGELEARTLGGRTGVYAEPKRIDAAAYELADTEKMVEAAESLYGPYRWGRYDMLVLPPSFPIGGMENPRLTFLTPTMIAGDRSLVDLIAHELAHSWSGNLVTNASWKHWWLNEGFTTYVTTRILEKLYGEEVALMNLQLEQEEAIESLKDIPQEKQALLTRDPDTSSTNYTDEGLAYPKGAWLLRTLEERAGRAVFDPFLRGWFDGHAFQSVTTGQFVAYLRSNLLAKHPQVMSDAELDEWLYGAGIPASAKHAKSQRLDALDATTAAWIKGELSTAKLDTKGLDRARVDEVPERHRQQGRRRAPEGTRRRLRPGQDRQQRSRLPLLPRGGARRLPRHSPADAGLPDERGPQEVRGAAVRGAARQSRRPRLGRSHLQGGAQALPPRDPGRGRQGDAGQLNRISKGTEECTT